MTQVDFHTGVADKLAYACRLLRKAYRAGSRVTVTGAADQLARLDSLLWTFDPGEFIPHLRWRDGQPMPAQPARTPIWLIDPPARADSGPALPAAVLVNLGPEPVADALRFERVIEIVAEPADEVAAGRQRWRQYVAAGITPSNHTQRAA